MATVQAIIEAGFARSSANAPGKTAQNPELILHLNRAYQLAWAMLAAMNPDAFQSRVTVTLAAGVGNLPSRVIDLRRVQASGLKVHVVPVEELDRSWHLPPVVIREGDTLVTRGRAGDPGPTQALTCWVLANPTALLALTDSLDAKFPVRHEGLLVAEIAAYLATKDEGRPAPDRQAAVDERNALWAALLQLGGLTITALEAAHGAALVERVQKLLPVPGQ